MTSAAKIAANRRNARKSTGPRSQVGKMRSCRNAYRHGLAIPIGVDIAFANQIKPLIIALAAGASSPENCAAAQAAALAELELMRAQHVKTQIINSAARGLQNETCCEPAEIAALGFALQSKLLVTFDRYERRALARRNRALRSLAAGKQSPQPKTDAVRWRNLHVQSVWTLNIHALVKAVLASAPHASHGIWDCPEIKGLRVTVQLQSEQSGRIQFCFATEERPVLEFALTKIIGRHGGRQWGTLCPKTNKTVEDLFLKENEYSIGTRYSLGLTYRSKRSKTVRADRPASMQDDVVPSIPIELPTAISSTTTLQVESNHHTRQHNQSLINDK